MNFNDEVDWSEVFGGDIARGSLADPANKRRSAYVLTMVFVEAGLREVEDQLSGRSRLGKEDLSWARITRGIVVDRAKRLARDEGLPELSVGEGGFKDRWPGLGGMSNFLMCLVKYACTAPRWRAALDYGPRKVLAELPKVRSGELTLPDLITRIARHDLRMQVRLAKFWLFQLSLTMDATWREVASKAYRDVLESYAEHWVPVYDEGIRLLQVKLRPGMNSKKLSAMVSAAISGFAEHIAGTGDESYLHGEDGVSLFAESVQYLIYAALDQGDGRDISRALSDALATGRAAG